MAPSPERRKLSSPDSNRESPHFSWGVLVLSFPLVLRFSFHECLQPLGSARESLSPDLHHCSPRKTDDYFFGSLNCY